MKHLLISIVLAILLPLQIWAWNGDFAISCDRTGWVAPTGISGLNAAWKFGSAGNAPATGSSNKVLTLRCVATPTSDGEIASGTFNFRIVHLEGAAWYSWGGDGTNDEEITLNTTDVVTCPAGNYQDSKSAYFTATVGKTYQILFQPNPNGPGTSVISVLEFDSNTPTISSVSGEFLSSTYKLTLTASGDPGDDQKFYVRYHYNGESFATASFASVSMTGTETTATVGIPTTGKTSITYYVFSTESNPTVNNTNADALTLWLNNNGGANYSVSIPDGVAISHAGLGESNLQNALVNLTLTNGTFTDNSLATSNFVLNNPPIGVNILTVNYTDATHATVELVYDGSDFDVNIPNFSIKIKAAELSGESGVTSITLIITAIVESGNTVKKVVLQAFWWDYWNSNYPNSWANYLTEMAPRLKALDIDAVWIPPSYKNTGTNSVGYSPFDHYDIGDKYQKNSTTTRFGTKDEFLRMVAVMHANGIEVIQDVVLNHVDGAGASNGAGGEDPLAADNKWKNFRYVSYKTPVPYLVTENETEYLSREGRWYKNAANFHPHALHNTSSGAWAEAYWGPDFCYGYEQEGNGNGYGESSNAIYNPVQTDNYNRDEARNWIMWLKKQTGVDGFRWDAVKHFPHFVVQDLSWNLKYGNTWANLGEEMFNVGEYVEGKSELDAYVNSVTGSNGGNDELIGTFDFGLRSAFYGVITGNGNYDLGSIPTQQQNERVHYYSGTSTYVHRTVPFVNNHDTFRPQKDASGNYTGWNTGEELAPHIDPFDPRLSVVYATMLAMDGNPQIFLEDLYNLGGLGTRYSHLPTSETDLPTRSDLENIIWCHQNLDFKNGAYKVRWQANDALVIERSTKALIAVNDNWNTWQNLVGVQTDFADGTQLKDYSGANGTAVKTVYGGGKVDIDIPPCDGTASRRGYAIWAPVGITGSYEPPRAISTTQEWEMADDLGDSHYLSLGQGGETPDNSTTQRLVGKIFAASGTTVTYALIPKNASNSLTLGLYDLEGNMLDQVSGTSNLSDTYSVTATGWMAIKVHNTSNTYTGQGCYVKATYTAPASVVTSTYSANNKAAIWTGNVSGVWTDHRNWEQGTLPASSVNVVIPTQNTANPLIVSATMSCKNLIIGANAFVSIASGSTLQVAENVTIAASATFSIEASSASVSITGNITNAGLFDNCAGATVSYTALTNSGTFKQKPAAPVATSATGILTDRFTANWNASATATGYYFDVSSENTFSTGTISGFFNRDVANVLSFNVSPLSAATTYYYQVRAYNDCVSGNSNIMTVTTTKSTATITLSSTTQTYNGAAKPVTVTTNPVGLSTIVTYDATSTIPTTVGTYAVLVTIDEASYEGTATGTLTVNKATPTITTAPTASAITYNQQLSSSTLSGGVASTAGTFAFTLPTTAPAVGTASQSVTFTPTDATNFNIVTFNVSVTVNKATAGISITNISQMFNGAGKQVTVATTPAGLTVSVTYDGTNTIPSAIGTYAVSVSIIDANYQGTNTASLQIIPPAVIWTGSAWNPVAPTALADVTIQGNYTQNASFICKNLTVNSGVTLQINPTYSVTVNGEFVNSGTIILKSPQNGGVAGQLIIYDATPTGNVKVELWLSANTTHYIAAPVAGATTSLFSGVSTLKSYIASTGAWNPSSGNYVGALTQGKGYSVIYTTPKLITFTGLPKGGDFAFYNGLLYEAAGYRADLAGNPYTSAIDWDVLYPLGTRIDPTITYRKSNTQFANYNAVTKATTNGATKFIPAMQGFSIRQTLANGAVLTATNAVKVAAIQNYWKDETVISNHLKLKAEGVNVIGDESVVMFIADATTQYDYLYDGEKMFVPETDFCHLYSRTSTNENLAINALAETQAVTMYFRSGVSGAHSISVVDFNFDNFSTVILEDIATGKMTDLRKLKYEFYYTTGSEKQFIVHFSNSTTSIESVVNEQVKIYSAERSIYVNNPTSELLDVSIYDVMGRLVYRTNGIGVGINRLNINSLSGIFMVKAVGKQTTTAKVFVE